MVLGAYPRVSVSIQRTLFRKISEGSAESSSLTTERIRKLDEIGFEWLATDHRSVPWETRYQVLMEFFVRRAFSLTLCSRIFTSCLTRSWPLPAGSGLLRRSMVIVKFLSVGRYRIQLVCHLTSVTFAAASFHPFLVAIKSQENAQLATWVSTQVSVKAKLSGVTPEKGNSLLTDVLDFRGKSIST